VQREASASKAVRQETEAELNTANAAAATARRELEIARRLQHDAEARMQPLIQQLDDLRCDPLFKFRNSEYGCLK
jgi:hypothetical protein